MTRPRVQAWGLVLLTTVGLLGCPQASASTAPYRFYSVQGTPSEPVRWNPCAAVTYRINPNGYAGTGAISRVRAAVAEVSAATGIRFSYLGRTAVVPDDPLNPTAGTTADVVIAWARSGWGARRSAMMPSGSRVVGIGGYSTMHTNRGFQLARHGYVVFNAGRVFTMSARRQYVVALHELGHLVGLDDVTDARQIMNYSVLLHGPSHYASGDLWGLHRLGRRAGCLVPAPAPRPPTIARSGTRVSVATPTVTSVSGPVTYALSSPELGQLATSSTPAFTVPLGTIADRGYAGRAVHFQVRAANRVGATTSSASGFSVPTAVVTRAPAIVVTPSSLVLQPPRAVLSGTTLDVSDLLRTTTTGTVGVYQERGLTYTGGLYEHMLFAMLPIWEYHVTGSVAVRGAGLQRSYDVSGVYRTTAWQLRPPPVPDPLPAETPSGTR